MVCLSSHSTSTPPPDLDSSTSRSSSSTPLPVFEYLSIEHRDRESITLPSLNPTCASWDICQCYLTVLKKRGLQVMVFTNTTSVTKLNAPATKSHQVPSTPTTTMEVARKLLNIRSETHCLELYRGYNLERSVNQLKPMNGKFNCNQQRY